MPPCRAGRPPWRDGGRGNPRRPPRGGTGTARRRSTPNRAAPVQSTPCTRQQPPHLADATHSMRAPSRTAAHHACATTVLRSASAPPGLEKRRARRRPLAAQHKVGGRAPGRRTQKVTNHSRGNRLVRVCVWACVCACAWRCVCATQRQTTRWFTMAACGGDSGGGDSGGGAGAGDATAVLLTVRWRTRARWRHGSQHSTRHNCFDGGVPWVQDLQRQLDDLMLVHDHHFPADRDAKQVRRAGAVVGRQRSSPTCTPTNTHTHPHHLVTGTAARAGCCHL